MGETRESLAAFLRAPRQRRYLLGLLLCFAVTGVVLHAIYPYPNTYEDTIEYVVRAGDLKASPYRPPGYTVYLRVLHGLVPHGSFIFLVEFLLYAAAASTVLLTLRYFFPPSQPWLGTAITVAVLATPATLYLTKTLLSDALFTALAYFWMASLLWFLRGRRPRTAMLVCCAVLYLLCNVRYNGLPFVIPTVAAVFVRYARNRRLWLLAALPVLAFTLVIAQARAKMQRDLGYDGLTPMGDWMLLNGVLHMFADEGYPPFTTDDAELRTLHAFITATEPGYYRKISGPHWPSCASMWQRTSPLRRYHATLMVEEGLSTRQAWCRVAPVFRRYARHMILRYPLPYVRSYILPNLARCMRPELGVLRHYAPDRMPPHVKDWLGMGNATFAARAPVIEFLARFMVPGWWALSLLSLAAAVAWVLGTRAGPWGEGERAALGLLLLFLGTFAAFQVIAAPVVLRYCVPLRAAQVAAAYLAANAVARARALR